MRLHENSKCSGFTIIELMITIVVVSMILAFAIPSFREIVQNNRMVSNTNEFVTSMNLARSAAVKHGKNVYVASIGGTDWSFGWWVWADLNSNGTLNAGEMLRNVANTPGNITMTSTSTRYRYDPDGTLGIGGNSTLNVCDSSRSNETRRRLSMANSGRVSLDTSTTCP